ncbi:helix-turn-helix domain-containing protein [Cereibacter azotoformans]|uniref:helix-turn-helix domain-containing protein n=1 Tax=Cereibacter azotoformans TaxID=43057 RepID=UPI003B20E4F5
MKAAKLPKVDHDGVAVRIEALREALGLEKGDFALSFGVDPSSYSKILKGDKPLKVEMGYALAERWGVTLDFIYRGSLDRLPDRYASTVIDRITKG